MKNLLKNVAIIAITLMLLSFFNCTTKSVDTIQNDSLNASIYQNDVVIDNNDVTVGQSPSAIIINNGTMVVNLEIYDANGILVGQENNIEPGKTSSLKSFNAGETTFVVSNANLDKIIVLDMDAQMTNSMVIASNNQISSHI